MKFLYLSIIFDFYKSSFYTIFISKFFAYISSYFLRLISNLKFLNVLSKIILNVNFQHLLFNKEKILTNLLLLEILTSQKPFFNFTKKNNPEFQIEKGFLNGAKVTIQNTNLFLFLFQLFISYWERHTFLNLTQKSFISLNFFLNSSHFYLLYSFLRKNFFRIIFLWNNCFVFERCFFFNWNKLNFNLI